MNDQNVLSAEELYLALTQRDKKIEALEEALGERMKIGVKDGKDRSNALRESEERYHKMIEEVEDYAILMLDRQGIIQNWNKGAEKIKGYSEKEVVGKHFRVFYPPEDQEARLPETLIHEAEMNGKAVHEGWRVRKDGSKFWGSIVITALHDEDNRIIAFSKVTRDLTERKSAEDKLVAYARQLESQNKELQQFAYAAAHDMKEPLRKIQFYNSAILDQSRPLPEEKKMSYLLRSADAANRMQGLIEDLLAFAKISQQEKDFEVVDLNSIWNEALSFYAETIQRSKAVVESGPLPAVKGIRFQLSQLMVNILGNALKYQHTGRPARIVISSIITTQRDPAHETFVYRRYHKISIRDNGIGFDPKYASKIFEMFERLHTRDDYSGTGIGLAICKKIVENHQGMISAHAVVGEGAIFDIYLPLSETAY